MGYEVREYLLEKFNRTCVYCKGKNIPLEIDHITPKSRGGSDRVSNLTLACKPCNQEKGNKTATEYGHPHVENLAKKPLRDAAAMNITRPILLKRLHTLGLPIETGTGAQTKYNRTQRGLEKTHYIDAACVGSSTPVILKFKCTRVLAIKATGCGFFLWLMHKLSCLTLSRSRRKCRLLPFLGQPFRQAWRSPLKPDVTAQADARDALVGWRAATSVAPNPAFRHSPACGQFCRVNQLGTMLGAIPARLGHHLDICRF